MVVFSGMPDPVWTIPASQISGTLAGVKSYDPMNMPARLGFRGFVLQKGKYAQLIVGRETMALQQQLLKTMPKGLLQGTIIKEIETDIKSGTVKAETVQSADTVRSKRNAPAYEPGSWESFQKEIQVCNNCYNYANNKKTQTVAQPGYAHAYQPYLNETQDFGSAVKEAAIKDGLIVGPDVFPTGPWPNVQGHVVALVSRPG